MKYTTQYGCGNPVGTWGNYIIPAVNMFAIWKVGCVGRCVDWVLCIGFCAVCGGSSRLPGISATTNAALVVCFVCLWMWRVHMYASLVFYSLLCNHSEVMSATIFAHFRYCHG